MAHQLGSLLCEMRTKAGFSLGKLAQKAGLNKSTLSRWESGSGLPRVPELEAVLGVLGASTAQRALAFACIEAPRALRHLRQSAPDPTLGAPPSKGDLLRSLRLRKGWTQEQTAAHLGVDRTTIVHWERWDRTPSTDQMQALCFALDAQEAEIVALAADQGLSVPSEIASLPFWEKAAWIEQRLNTILSAHIAEQAALWELEILTLEREAWMLAARKEAVRPLLARILAERALTFRNTGRCQEAGALAKQALNLLPRQATEPPTILRAAIVMAYVAVHSNPVMNPEHGVQVLLRWRQRTNLPEYAAWMLSDMSKYLLQARQYEASLELARQAMQHAGASTNPIEPYLRQMDMGRLLLQIGRPHDALAYFPEPLNSSPHCYAWDLLAHAEAHLQAGHGSEAHDWLVRAREVVDIHAIKHLDGHVAALAKQF